jgi:hypothetical membrane protein
MKKFIVSISFLLLLVTSFSQQTSEDYLKKSRNEKIAGGILIGGGVGLLLSGVFVGASDFHQTLSIILLGASVASFGIANSLFRSSARNKRIAMSGNVGLKIEKTTSIQQFGIAFRSYPAVAFQINSR